MELFEAIAKRHSYRGAYSDDDVPRADLERIALAGIQAPSGKNAQTTHFVIVDDAEVIAEIQAIPSKNIAISGAQAYIACVVDCEPPAVFEGHHFSLEDCAAAVENMLLAITGLGYASVWIDGWLRVEGRASKIGKILNLPEAKSVQVLLPIGRPLEQWQPKEKLPFNKRVTFNRYL